MSRTYEQLEPVISALDERIKTNLDAFPTDTAEGPIASFSDGADAPVKSLVVDIDPVQDLHGYESPWPAGGGVNLLPPYSKPSVTNNGVTLTNNNGEYTLNGTASSGVAVFNLRVNFPAGQYTVALNNPTANSNVQIYGVDENNAVPMQVACSTANSATTATFESTVAIFRIRVLRGGTVDNFKLSPVFSAGATAATKFYPYSNICPITGWTGCNLHVNDIEITISFPTEAGTVYGGTLDVTTGKLTVTKGFIQSYNGEALPGVWISDMDVYAQGATPTTGAEVCYNLTTPITYQLTPTEVKSLLGQNNIWNDTGDTNVVYRADTSAYIAKKIAEAISALS